MIILKATERNWGLIGPGDWDKRSWKIQDDGWYQYSETFRSGDPDIPEIPTVTTEGSLTEVQFEQLQQYMNADWPNESTDACDGTAWEFKMYRDSALVKHRDPGYIYGTEPFESIAALLQKE